MARVTHFEIPASDPEKSKAFYSEVFDWQFTQMGQQEYWLAQTGENGEQGIDGAIMKRRDPNQPVTNNIEVENLDETIEKIQSNGGQVVVEKMAIPNTGYLAFFKDPDGNIFGAIQPDSNV